jgi:hypothetical protein
MSKSGARKTYARSAGLARIGMLLLAGGLVSGTAASDSSAAFEDPPELAPSALLPASMISGADFHVVEPVPSDGLMRRYAIDSKFGRFNAYGRAALEVRIHEIAALTEIAKTSTIEVAVGGVGRGIGSQVQTAVGVVAHPVATATGVPKGIAHLFHGYVDEGKEAAGKAQKTAAPAAGAAAAGSSAVAQGESAAKRYASRYFGLTAAERRWYEKLGVDPYTDNAVLRKAIHKIATVEAAGGFGLKFVGIPSIPGIGDIHQVMEAVYKEDPATIRARTRATLAGYGLDQSEIERWQNVLVLSPTRQVLLLRLAAGLDAVDGRGELFRHAMGLTSDGEAQVYLQSVELLVLAHRKQPVASILAGVRLPAARRADGSIMVCGAFDAVYWTSDVERGEQQIRQTLTQGDAGSQRDAGTRELWLDGSASDRVRQELRERGWTLREVAQGSTPEAVLR